jgi:hypothetical protein
MFRAFNVVFFFGGDSLTSELFVLTFRNTLFYLHRWCEQELTRPMRMEQLSETSTHKIHTSGNRPIGEYNIIHNCTQKYMTQTLAVTVDISIALRTVI